MIKYYANKNKINKNNIITINSSYYFLSIIPYYSNAYIFYSYIYFYKCIKKDNKKILLANQVRNDLQLQIILILYFLFIQFLSN